jgi:hypothetical protein
LRADHISEAARQVQKMQQALLVRICGDRGAINLPEVADCLWLQAEV